MNSNADAAVAMFADGYNCAQSVLACCGGAHGLPRELAVRVAGPFGGGMARTGLTCGAVTGALMVIGLKYARTGPAEDAAREKGYELARDLMARFAQRNKSVCCRDLLGCDLSTPEGRKQATESGLYKTICPKCVRDAAEIVDDLLAEARS